jgi:hypothetical protein
MLRMWLGLALRAMERAASYSAELLADRHLDDLALAYRILYRAVMGRPAPVFRGVSGRVDAAVTSWEWSKSN